jgi:uncharacterized protein (TIGR02145 family)
MHKLISIIFLFSVGGVFSQSIENVDFRAEGKTIVVTYDFFYSKVDTAINVELVFKNQEGGVVTPKTISGDIKYVKPGESKRIVWDVLTDGIRLSGKYKAEVSIQKYLPINLKSVKIGNQVWMTENLNVERFRNGDLIPEAKTAEAWINAGNAKRPAWCYYDNDPKNGNKYGKLYNWYALNDRRGLAPAGWHVPTDYEWTVLSTFLGGENLAGIKMKSTSGWNDNGNGNNSNGFSGLPGGYRLSNGSFSYVGGNGCWWSASENDVTDAWNRYLSSFNSTLLRYYDDKYNGFSVRCIKD